MSPHLVRQVAVLSLAIAWLAPVTPARAARLAPMRAATVVAPAAPETPDAAEAFGRLPMVFEANEGQTDEHVRFVARGSGWAVFLTADETVLSLSGDAGLRSLRLRFVGAAGPARVEGEAPLEGRANYLTGSDPSRWRTDVPTYARVRATGVCPGVDVVYYGTQSELEYDFVVAPGADAGAIRMEVEGADSIRTDESGDLVMRVGGRELRQRRPSVYQESASGARTPVSCRYAVDAAGRVGFDVGAYDVTLPLVVDPVLAYATYLGGATGGNDAFTLAEAIAVDATGAIYVAGRTTGADLPGAAASTLQPFNRGSTDCFVTKLSPSGGTIVYSTYLGGTDSELLVDMAIDASGAVYVCGITGSTDFPTVNAFLDSYPSLIGGSAGFVAKLSPSGGSLVFASYLGGNNVDMVEAIAVDASGSAYVTGFTSSTNFPTVNPLFGDTDGFGSSDAFVTKFTPSGNALVYSTYLGGNDSDVGLGIAVDASGSAYVTGDTSSTDFPTASPLFGDTNGVGDVDVFVTKLTPSGNALAYSTYLGGSGLDYGFAVAVDSSGSAYVTGETTSTDLPTANPLFGDTDGFGSSDAFVTKLTPSGNALAYSTYLGGSSSDSGLGIAVDASGSAYVTGDTFSTNFPTANPLFGDTNGIGNGDVFVTKLTSSGNALAYSTYLGGSDFDVGHALAIDASGAVYVTGHTASTNFPTVNPLLGDTDGLGSFDAFVTKLAPSGSAIVFSTYLDGEVDVSFSESGSAIAVDSTGHVYVTGFTDAVDFPTANPLFGDPGDGGNRDAFVAKLASDGSGLVYSTYLGGIDDDTASGVAVDATGAVCVVGNTRSPNFPTVNPLFGDTNGFGDYDAFVARLAPAGNALVYSTFLGGSGGDTGAAIAVDASGSAYVTGDTFSTNFPTVNPLFGDTNGFGDQDAFVSAFTPSGALVYSTYLGGTGEDTAAGIAVDASGSAYVTGLTSSTNFPTVNPLFGDTNGFGFVDAFVTKLTPLGSALAYSTYLGGSNYDTAAAVAVDASGSAYVTGQTISTNFPTVNPLFGDTNGFGDYDAFVTKLAPSGNTLAYSTYLGGGRRDRGIAVAVGASGSVYVTGETTSTNFPTMDPPFGDTNGFGTKDAFVAQLTATGSGLVFSTYLGGRSADSGLGVALDGAGGVYVVGQTFSTNFPQLSPFDATLGAGSDAFVVKLVGCSLTCPGDVTVPSAPGQCGAAVSYPAPTANAFCGTVVCSPAPGSVFPVGTTTVTCTASDTSCSFDVTVVDVEPPSVACPANVTTTADTLAGTVFGATVSYAAPAVSDNCAAPGAPTCSPVSGTFFPVGTTTVTCTAADAAGNVGSCAFAVVVMSPFDACYVDDATGDTLSLVTNAASPLYRLWRLRTAATGAVVLGDAEYMSVVPRHSLRAYDHDGRYYQMDLTVNYGARTATATVKRRVTGAVTTIRDRDIANDPPCE